MPRFGDDNEGFSIDSTPKRVTVKAWGFWSVELSQRFAGSVLTALSECDPNPELVIEVGEMKPLRDEGQVAFGDLLKQSLLRGIERVVIRAPSALTKLQMMRLARTSGKRDKIIVE